MSEKPEEEKTNYLSQAWEILSRLSDEALNAARESAEERKFDKSRGIVGLDESLINLTGSRNLLSDAIEKNNLQQFPLPLQKRLISQLNEIQNSITLLANGTDEIAVLTERIENLNADIWRFGLHNISPQVLGYQTKLNQLKHQETELLRLQREIAKALELRDEAKKAFQDISSLEGQIREKESSISIAATAATNDSSQIRQFYEKASADLASVQTVSENAARLLAGVTTSNGNVIALEEQVSKAATGIEESREVIESLLADSTKALEENREMYASLHAQVESTASELSETLTQKIGNFVTESTSALESERQTAKTSVADAIAAIKEESADVAADHDAALQKALKNFDTEREGQLSTANGELNSLLDEVTARNKAFLDQGQADHSELKSKLENLEDQIKDKIYQATGFTLFSAFQARQNEVARAKRNWAYATLGGVGLALILGFYVVHAIHSVQDVRFEFFAKLSLSVPIIYAIGFCSIQYSKERRLEEEYAFKSSVSVSLNPYQELVAKLVTKTDPVELAKYTAFVISSVENVFSSPTDKVFETHVKDGKAISEGTVKQVSKLVEPLVQIMAKK
jgi:hypothetical protein